MATSPPSSSSPAAAGHSDSADAVPTPARAASTPRLRWQWPVLALLGGLAAAAGSEVIARTQSVFFVDPARIGMPPYSPELEREMWACALGNHALGFGGLGLVTCGVLAAALVALGGSPLRALGGLALGAVLGALFGAAGGAAAFLIDATLIPVEIDGLFKAVLIHLPNWLLLGTVLAVVAVALARPRPRPSELLLAVLAAGIGAALLYPILGLIFFTTAYTDRPVPSGTALRVLCFAVGGMALGLAAARWLRPSQAPAAA